jgi:hypothetical protein
MTTTLRFEIDITNVQEADDGNTTTYGGSYVINGEEKRAYGDDRSWSYLDDIMARIQQKVEETFGVPMDSEDLFDAMQEVSHATIVVAFDGTDYAVTVES